MASLIDMFLFCVCKVSWIQPGNHKYHVLVKIRTYKHVRYVCAKVEDGFHFTGDEENTLLFKTPL